MSEPVIADRAGVARFAPFWTRHLSRTNQFVLDVGILAGSFVVAYLLRFEFDLEGHVRPLFLQLGVVVAIQLFLAWIAGIYSFIWRYIGLAEVHAFLAAAIGSAVPLVLLRLGLPPTLQDLRVPLSVIVIDSVLAFGGLLGVRVLRRVLYERYERDRTGAARRATGESGVPVILIGAGRAGVMAARELRNRGDLDLQVAGFVDDDESKRGSVVHGVRVLGNVDELPRLAAERGIEQVILTIAEATRDQLRRIVDLCEAARLRVRIIPGLHQLLGGHVEVSRVRDIEIEDLLGREPVRLDVDLLRAFLDGKRVMVTGAGGSIGGELARQIAGFAVAELLLVERSEGALFEIHRDLTELASGEVVTRPLVADVGDEARMRHLLARHRPHVLFHAAAHKHVPMMELNAGEAIKNNTLATATLGRLAGEAGVEVFVLISTDKAVAPTSLMGASKRLAELVIQDLEASYATRYVAVRFGNVLGSTGSVVPIFRRQIAAGGPVTVTDPEASRYFMTIPEASQLVLEAAAIGGGGEILILDMGEPVKIADLARDMIRLSGMKPGEDIEIVFTGLRPGEKLHEQLLFPEERIAPTRHPMIGVARLAPLPAARLRDLLARLEELLHDDRDDEIRALVLELGREAAAELPDAVSL